MPNLTPINGPEFGEAPNRIFVPPFVEEKLDYVKIALSRLTSFFSDKTLVKGLASAMVDPLANAESVGIDIKTKRWIDVAVGKQLDGAGYIVGEPRLGRTDAAYRDAILFRIFVNTSNATPEDLIKGLRVLTKPDDIQYMEQYPATAMLFTDGGVIPETIHDVIQGLSPAAISDVPVMVSFSRVGPFRFGRESDPDELFVNDSYLTAEGSDLQVQSSTTGTGSRLGGLAPCELDVNGFQLDVGGSILVMNVPNFDTMIDGGSHLVGVYNNV